MRGRLAKPVSRRTFNSAVRIKAAIGALSKKIQILKLQEKTWGQISGAQGEPKAGYGVPLLKGGALGVRHHASSCPEVPATGPNCLLRAYVN